MCNEWLCPSREQVPLTGRRRRLLTMESQAKLTVGREHRGARARSLQSGETAQLQTRYSAILQRLWRTLKDPWPVPIHPMVPGPSNAQQIDILFPERSQWSRVRLGTAKRQKRGLKWVPKLVIPKPTVFTTNLKRSKLESISISTTH